MGGGGRSLAGAINWAKEWAGDPQVHRPIGKVKRGGGDRPKQATGLLGTPGSPRGRRRGGPTVAPPGTGVKRTGGAAAVRAGTGPASSRPRLPARSPPPGARKGKGREGGRGGRTLGFPQPPGEEPALSGSRFSAFSSAGSSSSLPGAQLLPPPHRAWHPRGASSPRACRVAPTTSPPAARGLTQPIPSQLAA